MDDRDNRHSAADPARAFEDLRAEVSVLRRAVEALPHAWEEAKAPDYSPDMARMTSGLSAVAKHLHALERHPALVMTPDEHRAAMVQAGSAVMREAQQHLETARRSHEAERQQVANMIGTARTQQQQFTLLCWVGAIAVSVGLILSPLVASFLPFGLNSRVAALVMHDSRWGAGQSLMNVDNPAAWQTFSAAGALVDANKAELETCRAVAKPGKGQRCMITLLPPEGPR